MDQQDARIYSVNPVILSKIAELFQMCKLTAQEQESL